MSETGAGDARPNPGRWAPGTSGNPRGRPRHRSRIAPEFLKSLEACWEVHGAALLAKVCADHPLDLVKLVARLVPREAIEAELPEAPAMEVVRERVDPAAA